jgi:hypothetical protein
MSSKLFNSSVILNGSKLLPNVTAVRYRRKIGEKAIKPPWLPLSNKKQFYVPKRPEQSEEEKSYIYPIILNYKAQMRSVYQLFKSEVKFSSQETMRAKELALAKRQADEALYEQNKKINEQILKVQLEDLRKSLELKKIEAKKDFLEMKAINDEYVNVANEKLKKLKDEAKTFINEENLDREIDKMLNEHFDYNFSVDASGQFYKNQTPVSRIEAFDSKFIVDATKKNIKTNIDTVPIDNS